MKIQRAGAIAVLLAGAALAFYIGRGKDSKAGGVVVETRRGGGFEFEKARDGDPRPPAPPPIQAVGTKASPDNLTAAIVEAYTRDVLEPNFENFGEAASEAAFSVPSEKAIEEIVAERFSEPIDFQLYRPESVRTTEDNAPEREREYLLDFSAAYERDFGDNFVPAEEVLNQFMDRGEARELFNQMAMTSRHIAGLLQIETPSAWKDFHLKNINNWRKRFVIYEAISKIDSDPVRALVATREIEPLIAENEALRAEVTRRFGELSFAWEKDKKNQ